MDKESKSGGGLPGNGIVAIVLVAAGVLFVKEVPLQTTRPLVNEPRLEQPFALQDIDARLWQDPFGALAKARAGGQNKSTSSTGTDTAAAAAKDPERTRRSREKLSLEIERKVTLRVAEYRLRTGTPPHATDDAGPQRVEILAVMLPGGAYSESVESRRRTRYAVLAGLNASRLAPADTEHIGYFYPDLGEPKADPNSLSDPLNQPVPFEWFEPAVDTRQRDPDKLQPLVLVMWLPAEAFNDRPLQRLYELTHKFDKPYLHWRVLGPNGSDGLKAMVDEAAPLMFKDWLKEPSVDGDAPQRMKKFPVRFYSGNATVPDKVLLANVAEDEPQDLVKFFKRRHVNLVRTIGDDANVADRLRDELELRGLQAGSLPSGANESGSNRNGCRPFRQRHQPTPDAIALVAEWDTLYGRSLRRQFRASDDERGFCVVRFNYVRGLDGYLPSGGDAPAASSSVGKQAQTDKDGSRRKDGTFIETAEGQSQFDYLRRLAVEMREMDNELRRTSADGRGLRAIGILGNDVHDKLLVMQALRPEFPTAIFFTTDMDARFLHPREQGWARNLVVGSSFGLELTENLQSGTPPFRSSYQTSAFLATQLAMADAAAAARLEGSEDSGKGQELTRDVIRNWFNTPRIFEIGRTTAFDYSGAQQTPPNDRSPDTGPGKPSVECRRATLAKCLDIHAPGTPHYPTVGKAALIWVFALLLLALWAPLAYLHRRGHRYAVETRERCGSTPEIAPTKGDWWLRFGLWAAVIVSAQLTLPFWLADHWQHFAEWLSADEPLVILEGISVWPTEAIRLATTVLCAYLLYAGWRSLSMNLEWISDEFDSKPTRKELIDAQSAADKEMKWRYRLAQMFAPPCKRHKKSLTSTSVSMNPTAAAQGATTPEADADQARAGETTERQKEAAVAGGIDLDALEFWSQHIVQNRLSARLVRTTVWTALALLLSCLLMPAVGGEGFVPMRGPLSLDVHQWLRYPALVMMYFLIFFVVDATYYCVSFVRGLRNLRTTDANWPTSTVDFFQQQLRLPKPFLDNWIDLRFIALRTRPVTHLIYYPFIIISLWLLSKSSALDNWALTAGMLVPAVVGVIITMGNAVALRVSAERSRQEALLQVDDALMRVGALTGQSGETGIALEPDPSKEQLSLLRARIEGLHEGAFAPFWQQPLLKALLLPFATLGGTQLLDYMALANL